ncbi:MAG: GNAT family protein [Chloroflexota bacterium]
MLTGERIRLRALERDDLGLLHQFNNDLAVELAGGGDPPMPQSLARLEAEFDQRVASGGRNGKDFAIEANDTFIGICALFNEDNLARTTELGITIGDQHYWGKGYGRDALTLLVDYAFRYHNFRKVWLKVHASNARAVQAYERVGFTEEGRLREHVYSNGQYDDLIYMGILRSEWNLD